jgi:hypothetical protein
MLKSRLVAMVGAALLFLLLACLGPNIARAEPGASETVQRTETLWRSWAW